MLKVLTTDLKVAIKQIKDVCDLSSNGDTNGGDNLKNLSSYIEVSSDESNLYLSSMDYMTTVKASVKLQENNTTSNDTVTVSAKTLIALVDKITTEFSEFMITQDALTVTANGVYTFPVGVDIDGKLLTFPKMNLDLSKATKKFSLKNLIDRLNVCKPAVAETMDVKELNNYYLKDVVIASNGFNIAFTQNQDALKDDEIFISKKLGDIIGKLEGEFAHYYIENDNIYIVGDSFLLQGKNGINLDIFPIDAIKNVCKQEFEYKIQVQKSAIDQLIDRLILFVTNYDNDELLVNFQKDRMILTNKNKTSVESVTYSEPIEGDFIELSTPLNATMFKKQLETIVDDSMFISFGGTDEMIKIEDSNATVIVSLLKE